MSRIVMDDSLRDKLAGLTEPTEVRGPDGRVVGYFLPEADYLRMAYDWAKAEASDEELDAAMRQPGGMTLAEFCDSRRAQP